jgi:hypothetical protein
MFVMANISMFSPSNIIILMIYLTNINAFDMKILLKINESPGVYGTQSG